MASSMAFFRELRAPLVALAAVALFGALVLPPNVQAALTSFLCAPQTVVSTEDGSSTDGPGLTHCVLCAMALAMGPQPPLLGYQRTATTVHASDSQARARVASLRVRNRGPPALG